MSTKQMINKQVEMLRLFAEYKAAGINVLSASYQEYVIVDSDNVAQVQSIYDAHPNYSAAELAAIARKAAAKSIAATANGWWTLTPEELDTWCSNNLMSDADIDALTLSTALKKNLKANNAFVRNVCKVLIGLRDDKWPDR